MLIFFRFSMINFDYRRFHFVRYVFCFQYIFFMMIIVLLRVYPVQELSFSGIILFRNYSIQNEELSLSGIFPLIAAQKKHNLVAIIEAQKKEKQSEGCFLNRTFTSLESNCTKKNSSKRPTTKFLAAKNF